jgi:glucose-6-phosphate 1-epimerase
MSSLADLKSSFAIPDALAFDEPVPGFVRAVITIPSCTAELYLHGGHLTRWEPSGTPPVLFLSSRALYADDKAIRGGIPVIFPWFGARTTDISGGRTGGAQHGFARTAKWTVSSAARSGDAIRIVLLLEPTDAARAAGYPEFRATLDFLIGSTLSVKFTVANNSAGPLVYEEALHTYFGVSDIEKVKLEGLSGVEYLDKTDGFARKRQDQPVIEIHSETDRPYLNTGATVTIVDPEAKRKIVVAKNGSNTTVVWNPWANLGDLDPEGWRKFVCVEAANAAENRVVLAAGAEHSLETVISVEAIQ